MNSSDWIRPEWVFLIVAPVFGLACLTLTPPFQVADEPVHFFRIVQVAQGDMLGERRGAESGGEIPSTVIAMVNDLVDGDYYSGTVQWNSEDWSKLKPYLTQRADLSEREFWDFRARTIYAPVMYAPQVLGTGLARALNLPPLWWVYMGRLVALLFFVVMVFWAIRLTPICPWGFAVLALLPAVMFQAASLSADSFTTALLFLFTAWVLQCAYGKASVTGRDRLILIGLAALMGVCKSVYVLGAALVFLLSPAALGGKRSYWITCGAVVGAALLSAVLWSSLMSRSYVPLFDDIDEWAQVAFVLRNPIYFLNMLVSRFSAAIVYFFLGGRVGLLHEFFGVLGWQAAVVYVGQTSFAVLLFCAVVETNKDVVIPEWHRWVVGLILLGSVLMIAAANYIIWLPPGHPALALFGRYFHPIAPMAFVLLHNRSCRLIGTEKWKWLIPVYFVGVTVATIYVLAHVY